MKAATGMIRQLTLAMACIGLLLLSTAPEAGAEVIKGSDPSSNGTSQVLACEAMGGTAKVETFRNVAGDYIVTVTCSGGMGGGWSCDNIGDETFCHPTGAPLPTWGEVDPSVGTGNELWEVIDDSEVDAPVVTEPGPNAGPHVTAPGDDHDHDKNTGNKGKKHKKGKKGGKGRRK